MSYEQNLERQLGFKPMIKKFLVQLVQWIARDPRERITTGFKAHLRLQLLLVSQHFL